MKLDIDAVSARVLERQEKLKQLDLDKINFITKVAEIQSQISQKYDQLISLIQSHKSQLMEQLKVFKEKLLKNIENSKDETEREFVIRDSFTRYCHEVLNRGSHCDISRVACDLHKRAEELIKPEKPSSRCDKKEPDILFSPSVYLTSELMKNLIGEISFKGENNYIVCFRILY